MFYKGSAISGNGGGSGDAVWGSITGTLSDQTDLQTALNAKQDTLTAGSGIDITNNVISATVSGLTNTATGTNSLTILGTATTAANATNIGATSNVTGNYSTALGYGAGVTSGATRAIQIGEGTNNTSNTLNIGFGTNSYLLLNGSTGKIPNDRLNTFTGATSSVAGSAGLVPAPTANDVDSYLKGDGTWQSGIVVNNATSGNLAIGSYSEASSFNTTAFGRSSNASGMNALALGYYAIAKKLNSIQLGQGTNNTANTFQVKDYTLLDISTGIVPNDRLNIMTGADGTNAGTSGIIPAPIATDNTKFLRGDGTWAAVSGGGGLQNTASGSGSLTILGTAATAQWAVNIGESSSADANSVALGKACKAGGYSVAIGTGAETKDNYGGTAIGNSAKATGLGSIQLGAGGTNSEDGTFYVSVGSSTKVNVKLLDATGKIPNNRIDGATGSFTSQDGKTVTVTNGVITSIV